MICYHGSDTVVDAPKILEANRPLDFGGGFYVTSNKEQALAWAKRVAYRNNSKKHYVNVYEFDLEKAEREVTVIKFEKADKNWLDFICANRSGRSLNNYDIVIGPVADDRVYRVVILFENGDIDKESALRRLKTEVLSDQILFHTEKALSFLEFVKAEVITND
ncbi:MAG: DUF3990 domain-containing protein [Phascolarctobacterium sp.]|nr:DUF3990 domain-containing protein [Phascolarctobacterium sp.]